MQTYYADRMTRFEHIAAVVTQGSDRAARTVRMVRTQPSWIARVAVLVFLLVIGLPIAILVMFAFLFAALVFGVLAGVNILVAKVRGMLPQNDGRENVRIIRRAD